jgi:hypothetical protein
MDRSTVTQAMSMTAMLAVNAYRTPSAWAMAPPIGDAVSA